jgi:hypothetical protein
VPQLNVVIFERPVLWLTGNTTQGKSDSINNFPFLPQALLEARVFEQI